MPNGIRKNFFEAERGSKRAVEDAAQQAGWQDVRHRVSPCPPSTVSLPALAIKDLAHATIALVTSGGIVPKGNPDHIESSSASNYRPAMTSSGVDGSDR